MISNIALVSIILAGIVMLFIVETERKNALHGTMTKEFFQAIEILICATPDPTMMTAFALTQEARHTPVATVESTVIYTAPPTAIETTDEPPCMVDAPANPSPTPDSEHTISHIEVCVTPETIHVGEIFHVYAQAINVHSPRFVVRLMDTNDALIFGLSEGSVPYFYNLTHYMELVTFERVTNRNDSIVITLKSNVAGQFTLQTAADGEIVEMVQNEGKLSPIYRWSGVAAQPISIEILGERN